jgi:DNA-binding NarL/FixJ family response regulator
MSIAIPMTNQERKTGLRVLIVQNNAILRLGLRSVLERHEMQIVGETVEREEILEKVSTLQPDVVLFDGMLTFHDAYREYSAAQVVAHIRGSCGIFVMVPHANEESLFQFLLAGAAAYELDTLGCAALVEKVRRVAAGAYLVTDEVLRPVKRPTCQRPENVTEQPASLLQTKTRTKKSPHLQPRIDTGSVSDISKITGREIEVLQCILHGLGNKQIGARLGISDQTAKNHLTRIHKIFGVFDRTAAVVTALEYGLIALNDPLPDQQAQIIPREMPEAEDNRECTTVRQREEVAV